MGLKFSIEVYHVLVHNYLCQVVPSVFSLFLYGGGAFPVGVFHTIFQQIKKVSNFCGL